MYCRNCGSEMSDNSELCDICKTPKDEGTNFCQTCGFHTSIRTEFCINCGAKQKVTQKMKQDRVKALQKQALSAKRIVNIFRFFMYGSILLTVILFIAQASREIPDNLPHPFVKVYYDGSVYSPRDYMPYADENVQEYWTLSRQILVWMLSTVLFSIFVFIKLLFQKRKYKKILKALKEAKNVL